MRVGFSADGARRALNEIITGLWSFTNAQGFLTDDINERTGGAGVTVDGLLIRDAGIPEAAVTAHEAALAILESQVVDGTLLARLAAVEEVSGAWNFAALIDFAAGMRAAELASIGTLGIRLGVTAEAAERFQVRADGGLLWGNGTDPVDVFLHRTSANELTLDDAFTLAGRLALQDNLHLSESDLTLATGTFNNQATGSTTVLRILLSTGVVTITGFASPSEGRMLIIMNLGASALTLADEDAGSSAANRMLFTGGSDHVLAERDVAVLWYDDSTSRWKLLASTV